jgi:hypothetical protein
MSTQLSSCPELDMLNPTSALSGKVMRLPIVGSATLPDSDSGFFCFGWRLDIELRQQRRYQHEQPDQNVRQGTG